MHEDVLALFHFDHPKRLIKVEFRGVTVVRIGLNGGGSTVQFCVIVQFTVIVLPHVPALQYPLQHSPPLAHASPSRLQVMDGVPAPPPHAAPLLTSLKLMLRPPIVTNVSDPI
jgi:hypothetical protein